MANKTKNQSSQKPKKRSQEERSPTSTPNNEKRARVDLRALSELEVSDIERFNKQELKKYLELAQVALSNQSDIIKQQDDTISALKKEIMEIKVTFADQFIKMTKSQPKDAVCNRTYAETLKTKPTTLVAELQNPTLVEDDQQLSGVETVLLENNGPVPQMVRQKGGKIFITFNDEADSEQAKSILSKKNPNDTVLTNFEIRKRTSAAVVLHVDTSDPDTLKKELIHRNPVLYNQLIAVKIILKKKEDNVGHVKLILASSSSTRDHLISCGRVFINNHSHKVVPVDANREVRRCFRCQKYGHLMNACKAPSFTCGKCSEEHATRECQSTLFKCSNCGGAHQAGSKLCEKQKSEVDRYISQSQRASSKHSI